ncbi:MAG: hypothetical protein H7Y88_04745 [Phycisphaerales bacterium]|nr:hypothetical protein [Phycisphaerales bacterium]
MARRSQRPISDGALRLAQDRFIAAWGQMGSTWGISRTMAEIHALLFITAGPLNTDDVMLRLSVSRGNASMSLRALVDWGVISRIHRRGDRKEYFQAEEDVWTMLRQIIRERLRREVHPVLALLFEVRDLTDPAAAAHDKPVPLDPPAAGEPLPSTPEPAPLPNLVAEHNRRLDSLLELIQMLDRLGERFVGSEGRGLKLAATLLSKVS